MSVFVLKVVKSKSTPNDICKVKSLTTLRVNLYTDILSVLSVLNHQNMNAGLSRLRRLGSMVIYVEATTVCLTVKVTKILTMSD